MDKYAVVCVDISEGSNYVPQIISMRDTYEDARSDAYTRIASWAAKVCPKKEFRQCVKDGTICHATLHCWDESTCSGMQLNIQKMTAHVTVSMR